jgi:cysteine sulfinate desulfinase/cysteine desulfurase-like protein
LSAVRVSFGKDNTSADVTKLLSALTEIMKMSTSSVMMAANV